MKKQFDKKEVIAIFKDLDLLCKKEIKLHRDYFYELNSKHKLDDEQQGFIDGLEQVRKYIIKQYFDKIVKDTEEGEFIAHYAKILER